MKIAMKKFLILAVCFLTSTFCFSQEFTKTVSSKVQLIIIRDGHGAFQIEGHNKQEIIIKATGIQHNSKGKGLTPLYSGGSDTGIGLTMNETGEVIEFTGLPRQGNQSYHILVPENINIKAEWRNHDSQKLLRISNLKSSLEVHRINGKMDISNITGPLVLYSMHGETKIRFSEINHNRPISISSYNADIEIELEAATKASLEMSSGRGEIYTDFEIKRTPSNKKTEEERIITGTINGGGVKIILQSYAGNFYLKKY